LTLRSENVSYSWRFAVKEEDSLAIENIFHIGKKKENMHKWEKQWRYTAEKHDAIGKNALAKKLDDYWVTQWSITASIREEKVECCKEPW